MGAKIQLLIENGKLKIENYCFRLSATECVSLQTKISRKIERK